MRSSAFYPGTHVIIACFSVVSADSYTNICDYWYPEIKANLPDVPIILVATKIDLKDDIEFLEKTNIVPKLFEEGLDLKQKIDAFLYLGKRKFILNLFWINELWRCVINEFNYFAHTWYFDSVIRISTQS